MYQQLEMPALLYLQGLHTQNDSYKNAQLFVGSRRSPERAHDLTYFSG